MWNNFVVAPDFAKNTIVKRELTTNWLRWANSIWSEVAVENRVVRQSGRILSIIILQLAKCLWLPLWPRHITTISSPFFSIFNSLLWKVSCTLIWNPCRIDRLYCLFQNVNEVLLMSHCQKYHNTYSLFDPPKFCINIVSFFSWNLLWSEEKIKAILMQILEGQAKTIMVFF